MKEISLILACTIDGGIGYKNTIPWYIPAELKKFSKITKNVEDDTNQNAVIMGRKTWESIKKPLSNRINIVITRDLNFEPEHNVIIFHNLCDALLYCELTDNIEKTFIIGGASLYNECIKDYNVNIYLSVMFHNFYETDTHIDIDMLFKNFNFQKDKNYELEHMNKLFASYICTRKKL